MHKVLITPQKKNKLELKQLSPLSHCLRSHLQRSSRLQILQSPMTPNKDLFSQLLSLEGEHTHSPLSESPFGNDYQLQFQIMEEEESEDLISKSHNDGSYEDEDMFSLEENQDDDAGMKKRKRKSTAQIKMLKAELEVQAVWSKDKIAEMSEVTGLSQSQVYKWWWDQKKKNCKHETQPEKRKLIRKDLYRRGIPYDRHNEGYYLDESMLTKAKTAIEVEEVLHTEKKINKRLVFA